MKKRLLVIGILAGSLAIALPAQASYAGHELPAGAFVLAKRSADDGERYDDRSRSDSRRAQRPEDGRGYGYGYERRQRGDEAGDDSSRRKRGEDDQRERRESRDGRGGRR